MDRTVSRSAPAARSPIICSTWSRSKALCYHFITRGGVSERFMETVLKTVLVLVTSVGSNPTPSANLNVYRSFMSTY